MKKMLNAALDAKMLDDGYVSAQCFFLILPLTHFVEPDDINFR